MKSDVAFLILGSLVLLVLLRWGQPQPALVPEKSDPDVWLTPFYLRYNVAMGSDQIAIMPQGSQYTFGLGVPATSTGQRVVTIGR